MMFKTEDRKKIIEQTIEKLRQHKNDIFSKYGIKRMWLVDYSTSAYLPDFIDLYIDFERNPSFEDYLKLEQELEEILSLMHVGLWDKQVLTEKMKRIIQNDEMLIEIS